jgi:hypothetical protein
MVVKTKQVFAAFEESDGERYLITPRHYAADPKAQEWIGMLRKKSRQDRRRAVGLTSTLGLVIFMTIRTLKHSIDRNFLSRNIICKEITTLTTNVLKPSARLSSYKIFGYVAALVIVSYSVDRCCSFSRFRNDSTFNYYHLLLFLSTKRP